MSRETIVMAKTVRRSCACCSYRRRHFARKGSPRRTSPACTLRSIRLARHALAPRRLRRRPQCLRRQRGKLRGRAAAATCVGARRT